MKYMGSKNRHAKEIIEAIQNEMPYPNLMYGTWVEPFVGGGNMIEHIPDKFKKIGCDINYFVIHLFANLQKGWNPPENLSESEYKELREQSKLPFDGNSEKAALIGFAGICCSYAGKWFGGYARGNDSKGNARNYANEQRNALLKQAKKIKDVWFISHDYELLTPIIPPRSIIYCDPPYKDTTKYGKGFDHDRFWNWCDELLKLGHLVFVSEYSAPDGWREIWSKEVVNSLTQDTGSKKGIEKLFTKSNPSLT